MDLNLLAKRINALERVAVQAKPKIALEAVEHIIAVSDAAYRLESLIGLSSVVSGDVKAKVDSYLQDYRGFLGDVKENYPQLMSEENKRVYSLFKQEDVFSRSNLEEILSLRDDEFLPDKTKVKINFLYSLVKDNEREMVSAIGDCAKYGLQAKSVAAFLQPFDVDSSYDVLYRFSEFLLNSGESEGVRYLKKLGEKVGNAEERQKVIKLLENEVIEEDTALEMYGQIYCGSKDEEKTDLIDAFFACDRESARIYAIEQVNALAENLGNFEDIFELGAKVLEEGYTSDALNLFNIALSKETGLETMVDDNLKIAKTLENGRCPGEAERYYDAVLASADVKPERLAVVADDLMKFKNYNLALKFFNRSLGESPKYESTRDVAVKFLRAGKKDVAKNLLSPFADGAKTLDAYITALNPILAGENFEEKTVSVIDGLKRFNQHDDFVYSFEYMKRSSPPDAMIEFVGLVERTFKGKLPGETRDFFNKYREDYRPPKREEFVPFADEAKPKKADKAPKRVKVEDLLDEISEDEERGKGNILDELNEDEDGGDVLDELDDNKKGKNGKGTGKNGKGKDGGMLDKLKKKLLGGKER